MKNITIAVYAALMLSIFNSCTEDYPIDLSGVEPMLVVSGSISTDTMTHTVILTKSQDYFENKPFEGISSATVTISDGSKEFILLEDPNKKGYYRTAKNVFGEVGKTYTLSISNVDINKDGVYETYTASSKLNFVPSIDSIEIEKTRRFSQTQWVIKMTTTDPGDTRDFYLLKILKNNVLISDSLEEWGISDDEFFNGKTLKSYPTMTLSDQKKDEIVNDKDIITLEMSAVTKDYVYYINEVMEEIRGRNPLFGSTPANVRTNISNGAQGYFAAYAITRKSTVYHEK